MGKVSKDSRFLFFGVQSSLLWLNLTAAVSLSSWIFENQPRTKEDKNQVCTFIIPAICASLWLLFLYQHASVSKQATFESIDLIERGFAVDGESDERFHSNTRFEATGGRRNHFGPMNLITFMRLRQTGWFLQWPYRVLINNKLLVLIGVPLGSNVLVVFMRRGMDPEHPAD